MYEQCHVFFFSSRRRHTRCGRDWSSDVCSSDLPLTSGQLSLKNALWFALAQLLVCAVLLLAINTYSRWLALALVPLVVIYPLCKRFTYWPQVVLRSEERRVGKECSARWWRDCGK